MWLRVARANVVESGTRQFYTRVFLSLYASKCIHNCEVASAAKNLMCHRYALACAISFLFGLSLRAHTILIISEQFSINPFHYTFLNQDG